MFSSSSLVPWCSLLSVMVTCFAVDFDKTCLSSITVVVDGINHEFDFNWCADDYHKKAESFAHAHGLRLGDEQDWRLLVGEMERVSGERGGRALLMRFPVSIGPTSCHAELWSHGGVVQDLEQVARVFCSTCSNLNDEQIVDSYNNMGCWQIVVSAFRQRLSEMVRRGDIILAELDINGQHLTFIQQQGQNDTFETTAASFCQRLGLFQNPDDSSFESCVRDVALAVTQSESRRLSGGGGGGDGVCWTQWGDTGRTRAEPVLVFNGVVEEEGRLEDAEAAGGGGGARRRRPLRVHIWPREFAGFQREEKLTRQGVRNHPWLEEVSSEAEADYTLYLPSGPLTDDTPVGRVDPHRLVVLDYQDDSVLHDWLEPRMAEVAAVFKRSWVKRVDGAYLGQPDYSPFDHVFPFAYSIADEYYRGANVEEEGACRDVSVSCTIRPVVASRRVVLSYVTEATIRFGLNDAYVGQLNEGDRTGFDSEYLDLLRRSRIIVSVNPPDWEGDHRTWEAFASGALVFLDGPLRTPFFDGTELLDGVHVVYYDLFDKEGFFRKLHYYLQHRDEARAIALRGFRHAMAHHRAANRLDQVFETIV